MIVLKCLVMAGCAVAIFGVVTRELQKLDALIPIALPAWVSVVGLVVMTAGAALALACFWTFAAAGALSRNRHFPDPDGLIIWGPFRYARNPMTKGAWTVLCGWGLFQVSPAIIGFAAAMALLLHLFVVLVEEPKLERRFGECYRQYKRRVNRWVPSWRSLARGNA